MVDPKNPMDPKGLIREAYRIEGITAPECRSILIDWALSLPDGVTQRDALPALHGQYGAQNPDHPMTGLLKEGMQGVTPQGRRGGRAGRLRQ